MPKRDSSTGKKYNSQAGEKSVLKILLWGNKFDFYYVHKFVPITFLSCFRLSHVRPSTKHNGITGLYVELRPSGEPYHRHCGDDVQPNTNC